ncbi:hypothetical protein [Pyrobaculum islandicum]|uniref:hypothetical protein n=1 Tax=Pyrobaculum islandicum TaxID=2277 RepID=UPI000AD97EB0|nr:hypothetical protein [Pyrobaculum islandicum]
MPLVLAPRDFLLAHAFIGICDTSGEGPGGARPSASALFSMFITVATPLYSLHQLSHGKIYSPA